MSPPWHSIERPCEGVGGGDDLAHEPWDDSMETGSFIPEALVTSTKHSEVLGSFGGHVFLQLEQQPSDRLVEHQPLKAHAGSHPERTSPLTEMSMNTVDTWSQREGGCLGVSRGVTRLWGWKPSLRMAAYRADRAGGRGIGLCCWRPISACNT